MMKNIVMGVAAFFLMTQSVSVADESADVTELSKEREVQCLAVNIYHEARSQSLAGQLAVALVTRNRVVDKRFPGSYCQVVYQGPVRPSWKDKNIFYPVKHRCQFSGYCDGKSDNIRDETAYQIALKIALHVYEKETFDFTSGAVFYHAYYVKPAWARTKTRVAKIEDHIFYTWKY